MNFAPDQKTSTGDTERTQADADSTQDGVIPASGSGLDMITISHGASAWRMFVSGRYPTAVDIVAERDRLRVDELRMDELRMLNGSFASARCDLHLCCGKWWS